MSGGAVVQTVGKIVDGAREYARQQVTAFVRRLQSRLPVRSQALSARVKLTVSTRSSARWPVLAQANLGIGEQLVRAQVARLANPDEPRLWSTARRAVEPVAVPTDDRKIVRHECYQLARCTPDRAALTMDLMEYDCHLFIDADAGQDSLIYRSAPPATDSPATERPGGALCCAGATTATTS